MKPDNYITINLSEFQETLKGIDRFDTLVIVPNQTGL